MKILWKNYNVLNHSFVIDLIYFQFYLKLKKFFLSIFEIYNLQSVFNILKKKTTLLKHL